MLVILRIENKFDIDLPTFLTFCLLKNSCKTLITSNKFTFKKYEINSSKVFQVIS